jgi:hypothetical protein
MPPKNLLKLLLGLAVVGAMLLIGLVVALCLADRHGILRVAVAPPGPFGIEVRIDPTLGSLDALHPVRPGLREMANGWYVESTPEEGGWAQLAVRREPARHRVESVEIHMLLGQGAPRAQAAVRWYEGGSSPLFTDNEYATNVEGVVTLDSDRMPADGEERVIAYKLDGLRDGAPVRFEGKIAAAPLDLNALWLHTEHVR